MHISIPPVIPPVKKIHYFIKTKTKYKLVFYDVVYSIFMNNLCDITYVTLKDKIEVGINI